MHLRVWIGPNKWISLIQLFTASTILFWINFQVVELFHSEDGVFWNEFEWDS